MRIGGAGKRRDANEKPIIEALRQIGAEVWQLHGAGLPDLLVRWRRRYYVGEVKSDGGRLTDYQDNEFPVWFNWEDAFVTLGAKYEVLGPTIPRTPGARASAILPASSREHRVSRAVEDIGVSIGGQDGKETKQAERPCESDEGYLARQTAKPKSRRARSYFSPTAAASEPRASRDGRRPVRGPR